MMDKEMTQEELEWFIQFNDILAVKPMTLAIRMSGQTLVVTDSHLLNTGM